MYDISTSNDAKCRSSGPEYCQTERNPARVDRDDEQLEDPDEVEVHVVAQAGEGPDDGHREDGGHHHAPVSKLQQHVLGIRISR